MIIFFFITLLTAPATHFVCVKWEIIFFQINNCFSSSQIVFKILLIFLFITFQRLDFLTLFGLLEHQSEYKSFKGKYIF